MVNIGESFSAIILAGGKSRRMGVNKAELPFRGTTMLKWQVEKFRHLGVDDILISGSLSKIAGCTCVEDEYPGMGPLAGLQACLKYAKHSNCVVLGVDTPLISDRTLFSLIKVHIESDAPITVLGCCGDIEPLIGVYESSLSEEADSILCSGNASVRILLNRVGFHVFPYTGDEIEIINCNTPEDYQLLCSTTMAKRGT